ncbi:hypothetical protein [Sinomicrobium sp.]
MNRKLLIPFVFALLLGCQSDNKKKQTLSDEVVSDTTITDTAFSLSQNRSVVSEEVYAEITPDTTLNQKLFLEDESSFSNFYDKPESPALVEQIRESPVVVFSNQNNSQYLLAYQYEGNTKNTFSCFEIGYFEDENSLGGKSNLTDFPDFKTESGIGLGLSMAEIVQIKGEDYTTEESEGEKIVIYTIDDYEKSAFLKRYNMPGYFIRIALKDNAVRRIVFGFEYP